MPWHPCGIREVLGPRPSRPRGVSLRFPGLLLGPSCCPAWQGPTSDPPTTTPLGPWGLEVNGDRVWPGVSMREVAQDGLPPRPVWTPEPEHQSGSSDWGQPSAPTSSLLPGWEGRLLVKELEQAQEVG